MREGWELTPAEDGMGLWDVAFWGIGLFDGTSTW